MKLIVFIALIFFTALSQAQPISSIPEEKILEAAQSLKWQKIMHYKKTLFGGVESSLDGAGFFFAENGSTDPVAELKATIKGLKENKLHKKIKQPARCSFPLRRKFIEQTFNIKYPKTKCELWEKFLKTFNNPQNLSVVFSSAFPNAPGSMFGHLLIKVISKGQSRLLDSGLNFAAGVPDNENPLIFMFKGVAGGYKGVWSTKPYYVKVNEYINVESRDLWEYDLNFTPEETVEYIAHLWELETTSHFDYYFFDDNCALQMLLALEAVRPELNLSEHTIYVIPGEATKNVAFAENLVSQVHFRPSLSKLMYQKFNALEKQEKETFFQLLNKKKNVTEINSRLILDALIAHLDFLRNEQKENYKTLNYAQLRKSTLSHRASLGAITKKELARLPEISRETRPDLGHDGYSLINGIGYEDLENSHSSIFYNFRIKSAYHDLLNNDAGYTRFSHIDFPSLKIQYREKNKEWRLEELGVISLSSLYPMTELEQEKSWKLDIKYTTTRDGSCTSCHETLIKGGVGRAIAINSKKHIAYFLGLGKLGLSEDIPLGWRTGPGLELGYIANPVNEYKLLTRYYAQWYPLGSQAPREVHQVELSQSYSLHRNWELRNINSYTKTNLDFRYFQSLLQIHYFFN